jgi:glucosylceramidase
LALVGATRAAPVSVYVTAEGTQQRLSKEADLSLGEARQKNEHEACVYVDSTKKFQEIIGIGGALTDAAAETFYKLPEDKQRELIAAYYDPEKGIGYTLGRTHINSCDFSSESYTYVRENDASLASFSIAHDEKYRIPLIKQALAAAGDKLTLFVSPWSPPAWMKTNHDMLHGGHLKPESADAWAQYYVKFIEAYEKAGVPIWGLTVQNEPMAVQKWESCVFSAEEERDFVKNHLGPTLAKSSAKDKKLIVWDHNRTLLYDRARTVLDDPDAAKYVWGVGYHWYVEDCFDNARRVQEAFPNTHLLFTEGCNYPFDTAKLDEWQWGEKYGLSLIHDFNNGVVGWTDWNILLDERGGPNHVGNFCYAPVHGDTKTGQLHYMNSFYYIGHFSKFVRPGARRVVASATTDALNTTAFVNRDGSIVAVVMNAGDKPAPFVLAVDGQGASSQIAAHAIMTFVIKRPQLADKK